MTKRKKLKTQDPEPEVIKKEMGLTWKTALPGLGLLGLAGASTLAIKKWRKAMQAVQGKRV